MGADGDRVRVDGHAFWRAIRGDQATELTTATDIELDGDSCRWVVSLPGSKGGRPVESASRDVVRFMSGVIEEMRLVARSAIVRPVPKPKPKPGPMLPATAPVPCPLCGGGTPPSGGGGLGGEPWPDCELCDGAGVVTRRQAEEWRALHGR